MPNRILFILLLHMLAVLHTVDAQFYNGLQMNFGKNRVQYSTEKIWSHYRFEHFDTYFYQNGKELAINTAKYAEKILPHLQSKIEYYLNSKIQFVIFNSMSDMKQSNIGLADEESYNIGGITRVIGSTVILYFNGNYSEFERQIRKGIATVIVNQFVYGEELGANIKNSALMFLPDWFVKGLISYIADDWNTELDNIARNGFLSEKYAKFNYLTGNDAVIAGHSIWKYLKDTYGEEAVSNVVYLTKITRSLESGFLYYTGLTFKVFSKQWFSHYLEKYKNDTEGRLLPDEAHTIPLKLKNDDIILNALVQPDGNLIAMSVDRVNKKIIYIVDSQTGKRKKIFKTGYKIDEEQDLSYPLMCWHPGGELLAFIVEKKGIIQLYYYLLKTNTLERQSVFGVNKIHDISYAPNGMSLLVSATVNGQSDIFIYQLASKTFERITKDVYDDLHPRFVLDGKYIAFASNRISDTIVFDKDTYLRDYSYTPPVSENYNIFLYNYSSKSPVLRRITNMKFGNALHPMPFDRRKIQFLSDENGIMNSYLAETDSTISHVDTIIHYRYFSKIKPSTDYPAGIVHHDRHFFGNMVSHVVQFPDKWRLMVFPNNRLSQFTYSDTLTVTAYMNSVIAGKAKQTSNPQFDSIPPKQLYPIAPGDSSKVDINNYIFRGFRKKEPTDSIIEKNNLDTAKPEPTFILPLQRNYDVEYSINQLVSQLDYSFLNTTYQPFTGYGPIFMGPGLNAFFKIGINDLLEDYRITGGFRLSVNLRNNEYFLSIENYKSRLDKKLIFHRQSYDQFSETSFVKHHQNNLHYILQYPFSNVLSLRPSFMIRQDKGNYLSIDYQNLLKPAINEYWGGVKTELVFDNTRNPQLNIYYGQRWKIWAEYLQRIAKDQINLMVLGLDFRNYTKIHRNFIFANRLAASTSIGNHKLIYYLGGVDNWILPRFNYDVNISDKQNYVFQALATNMRGFSQNIRNGNSFVVINSELRLPVFGYFLKRPIRSDFLRNFQIVGFGDIGTAWEGWNPFSEDNSLFTHVVQTNSLTVIVKRQKNPIVGGFGTGLRTKMLGYFIKADLAWGVEDAKILKPIFYISLSLDF